MQTQKIKQTTKGILQTIELANFSNAELESLRNDIGDLIKYKVEFAGKVYEVERPPPLKTEEPLKIDEPSAFARLVVPYVNSYSFEHIEDFQDLANAVHLCFKAGIDLFEHALKDRVGYLLRKFDARIDEVIFSKRGREQIHALFRQKIDLVEVDFKKFMRNLRSRRGDIIAQLTPIAIIAVLKILAIMVH